MTIEVDNSSFIKSIMKKTQQEWKPEDFFEQIQKRNELIKKTKSFFLKEYTFYEIITNTTGLNLCLYGFCAFFVVFGCLLAENWTWFKNLSMMFGVINIVSILLCYKSKPKFLALKNQIKQIETAINSLSENQRLEILKKMLSEVKNEKTSESFDKIINFLSKEHICSTFYEEMANFKSLVEKQNKELKDQNQVNKFKLELGLIEKQTIWAQQEEIDFLQEKYKTML